MRWPASWIKSIPGLLIVPRPERPQMRAFVDNPFFALFDLNSHA
jgi:hypothetical protein